MTREAPEYDAVIAGGGLSGLSLAARLATTAGWRDRAVLVVDEDAGTPTACWASWSDRPGLLDRAVSRSYERVLVHAAGAGTVVPLAPFRYRLVRRSDLRRVVLELLSCCPRFELRRGYVQRIGEVASRAEVVVDGEPIQARWAFDSVTARPAGTAADAKLAFTGWEVRTERPVFDPATPTLFDFRTAQSTGARFVYVLPDGPNRALVELTAFVPGRAAPPSSSERADALAGYLHEVLRTGGFEVLRTEAAVLPLQVNAPPRRRGRVLTIGARAGLIKASTGYAYQRIQHDSAAIARSLVRHDHPFDLPARRRRYRLLDSVLLELLDREPAELQRAFGRLFSANPAARVLRFLDEQTSLGAEARLIASLPPAPFVKAAAARALHQRHRPTTPD